MRLALLIASAATTLACSATATRDETVQREPVSILKVDGADNRGASVAALGTRVVLVWAATQAGHTDVFASVSEDGGRTFGAPARVNDIPGDARVNGEQPPRVAMGAKDVVVAWQSRRGGTSEVRTARSLDGGRTFLAAQTEHPEGLSGARGWSSLTVDSTGAAHAAWLDGRNNPVRSAAGTDPKAAHMHAEPMRQDIFHVVARPDGTRTESLVATNVCFCCKTSVAVGPDGATYVAWRHIYPTNLRDMAVARSHDGQTFQAPVRVSEDGWVLTGCPEDGPSIAVDGSNVVHIAWPTIVDESASRKGIFYSYSTDAGRTFAPRIRLDDAEGTKHAAHPQLTLTSDAVAVTWEDRTESGPRIRARIISSSARGMSWSPVLQPIATVIESAPVTYPAITATTDALVVVWTQSTAERSTVGVRRISIAGTSRQ